MLAVTATDRAGHCSALVGLVPDEWGEPGDAMAGGGTENGFTIESCAVRPAAFEGGTLSVDIADGRGWYDFELADETPRTPVVVEGIGDAAYAYGRVDGFVVLVGDCALVVSGENTDGEALEPAALEARRRGGHGGRVGPGTDGRLHDPGNGDHRRAVTRYCSG